MPNFVVREPNNAEGQTFRRCRLKVTRYIFVCFPDSAAHGQRAARSCLVRHLADSRKSRNPALFYLHNWPPNQPGLIPNDSRRPQHRPSLPGNSGLRTDDSPVFLSIFLFWASAPMETKTYSYFTKTAYYLVHNLTRTYDMIWWCSMMDTDNHIRRVSCSVRRLGWWDCLACPLVGLLTHGSPHLPHHVSFGAATMVMIISTTKLQSTSERELCCCRSVLEVMSVRLLLLCSTYGLTRSAPLAAKKLYSVFPRTASSIYSFAQYTHGFVFCTDMHTNLLPVFL